MSKANINYDELSDTLYISFEPGRKATGIELNDHILLRVDKRERKVIGITIFEYSLVAQKTEVGPRSFPLTGLSALSDELRSLVLELLARPPASEVLSLSAYTPSAVETIPITRLQEMPVVGR